MAEVRLPEMGEGIAAGDVVRVLVKAGDSVTEGQGLIELETDKALIEVPSDAGGVIDQVLVKQGDKLKVGAPIVSLQAGAGAPSKNGQGSGVKPAPQTAAKPAAKQAAPVAQIEQPAAKAQAGKTEATIEEETAKAWDEVAAPGKPATTNGLPKPRGRVAAPAPSNGAQAETKPAAAPVPSAPDSQANLPAGPATRRIARELGVNLATVRGTGPGGRIYQSDVIDYYKQLSASAGSVAAKPLPDFSRWGNVRREELSNVRRKIAEQMALCAATVAQVTQFERADITELEALRARQEEKFAAHGGKLSFTVFAIRAVAIALRAFPRFNASLDLAGDAIIYKDYLHLGIAVDTERGLLVPVLRDVDKKDMLSLSVELPELADRVRHGKVGLDELHGASFTISNQGSLGGAEFTPIVNWPEAAILGIGRARKEPGINPENDGVEPRLFCPLALSYDHRLNDGADAARWIKLLKELLEDPERLLLGV